MSFLKILKKIFSRCSADLFSVSVAGQKAFLDALPTPKDDLERSYLQYRCQSFLMKRGTPFLANCAAIPLLLLYSLKLQQNRQAEVSVEKQGAVFLFLHDRAIMPDSLRNEFEITQIRDFQSHLLLTKEDLAYLRALRRRYPFSFYFRFKCLLKVAMYSHVIAAYRPRAIICSSEYSFTSSLLTDYCRQRSVEHINIMHGEKLYNLTDSFFHFDRCYVWDKHYVDLFTDLRAKEGQFISEIPPCLRLPQQEVTLRTADYTYYLAAESRAQLEVILKNLSVLTARGLRVTVRPHPLHLEHLQFLQENPFGILVEDSSKVSIEESLLQTGCVVSLYSTVLLQAVSNGIPIVIDDISSPSQYQELRERRFICMEKSHRLLSELIKER